LAETVARARAFLSRDAANRVLMIFDDLPWDIGLELSDGVLDGSDVILCAAKPPDWSPMTASLTGLNMVLCSTSRERPRRSTPLSGSRANWNQMSPRSRSAKSFEF
jgi:hypothetical protein